MNKEEEKADKDVYVSNNQGFTESNALQIRLNTEPILRNIEFYLRGYEERLVDNKGEPEIRVVQVAEPKANSTGIHNIMAWVSSTFNTQVVQGNFKDFEHLYDYLADFRIDLTDYLMNNLYDWEIRLRDFEGIVDLIVQMNKLFLSRLVADGERRSYSNTIQHRETSSHSLDRGSNGFKLKIPGFK